MLLSRVEISIRLSGRGRYQACLEKDLFVGPVLKIVKQRIS